MKHGYLIDMDGVIYRGSEAIPGAGDFIRHLDRNKIPYLFLTNNSAYTQLDVVAKLKKFGIETSNEHVYTSALATAEFVSLQKPKGTAFVIGEPGFSYNAGSDEYGTVTFERSEKTYKVGDRLEVIVPHCDPVINLYDFMYGIRGDKVESVLPILARGKSQ